MKTLYTYCEQVGRRGKNYENENNLMLKKSIYIKTYDRYQITHACPS
jgi:hypothetical protein